MISEESRSVAIRGQQIYNTQLADHLEQQHFDEFVCIEPLSGGYCLGDTFDAAVNSALETLPGRLTHTVKIGHRAAIHLGVLIR